MHDKAKDILNIARVHLLDNYDNLSSVELCLSDAENLFNKGDFNNSIKRALKSIQYSVGCFHNDYKLAIDILNKED